MHFELYHRYTLTSPNFQISEAGIQEIMTHINRQRLNADEWRAVNPDCPHLYLAPLPDDWEWLWIVTTGEYRGKFATRIAQFYHKSYRLKCPLSFLQTIGNLARTHSELPVTYQFEFVNRIDW